MMLQWTMEHSVYVAELDDQHREIFEAINSLYEALTLPALSREILDRTEFLESAVSGHFAHEERLMHASRYEAFAWHRQQHRNALRRVRRFVRRIRQGDAQAGCELVDSLSSWLHGHTRLTDRMLGAFLRNYERSMFKVTFRAGTRPREACSWTMTNGKPLS
jgi:hemerythrin-like metal-binding protein